MKSVSAISSGVRFLALVIPQMTALIVIGAIVTKWGFYVRILSQNHSRSARDSDI